MSTYEAYDPEERCVRHGLCYCRLCLNESNQQERLILKARIAELETQLKDAVEAERKTCTSLSEWAVAEAVAKEREACAVVAENFPDMSRLGEFIAGAIRARGAR